MVILLKQAASGGWEHLEGAFTPDPQIRGQKDTMFSLSLSPWLEAPYGGLTLLESAGDRGWG